MKKTLRIVVTAVLLITSGLTFSQTTGDLAFVGINADGNDDLSLVTFVDIPANTTFYLRDDEWNGTAFGDANEAIVSWNSGSGIIAKGSIIAFSNFGSTGMSVNYGTVSSSSANLGIGNGDEAIFIYTGSISTPTTFITALGKGAEAAAFGTLAGTGLAMGSTALYFPVGIDVAAYKGARSGYDKSGFLSQVNQVVNWETEDGSGDQHNNGISPDVPFSTNQFTFGTADNIAPQVSNVLIRSSNSLEVQFNETVTIASATNPANFVISPALAITGLTLSADAKSATVSTAPLVVGRNYTITINNITDQATVPNTMTTAYQKSGLYFNDYAGNNLSFTEIMYNVGAGADSLEFVEIHNSGTTALPIGGLTLSNGIVGVLPERNLAPGALVCVALDSAAARRFYGTPFLQWSTDALGNGGEAITIRNFYGAAIDSVFYDDAAPWPLTPDGSGPSLEIINAAADNNVAANWRASNTNTGKTFAGNLVYASPGLLPVVSVPSITFKQAAQWVSESKDSVTIAIDLNGQNASGVTFRVEVSPFGTASVGDYKAISKDTVFAAGTTGTMNIKLALVADAQAEGDEYFVVQLNNITGANVVNGPYHTVHIIDDEPLAPAPSNALKLQLLSSYKNGLPNVNSAEIVAYEQVSKRLFIVNSIAGKLDIVNFANPALPTPYKTIDISALGGINSIAIRNGVIAAAIENVDKIQPGKIVFFDTTGNIIKQLTAGILPDMIGISPDGKYVVTANEAEPVTSYLSDPEGSVTITDISGGIAALSQANVTTVNFAALNPLKAALRASGVRLFGRAGGVADGSTVSQDLEPEYVAFSPDSKLAYVTLQENNAIIVIDLQTRSIAMNQGQPFIKSLGLKDHLLPGNGFDASNVSDSINISRWPVKGMYMPDAIAGFKGADGKAYFLTANEGDVREYDALTEETTVRNIKLDPSKFADSAILRVPGNLGNLVISNQTGDTDGDGDFDELHVFGARSFSILDSLGNQVWDSGDQFEQILKAQYRQFFNTNNTGDAIKNRSDNKGPEPEGITVATLNNRIYAFITLERPGGVMVYDVTNPSAPQYVTFAINRILPLNLNRDDMGPEGVLFIPAAESPNNRNLLLLANEVSSSISVFEVADQNPLPVKLLQFTGIAMREDVLLQWQVADHNEMEKFDVQHSTDGFTFKTIGVVSRMGSTYQFTHQQAPEGLNYYRLLMYSKDGDKIFTRVVTINNNKSDVLVLSLLNNPVKAGILTPVVYSGKARKLTATITTASGSIISHIDWQLLKGENSRNINVSQLAPGIYFISVQDVVNGKRQTLQFVK